MTRIGLAASFFHTFGPPGYVALAREAEQRGYDTIWTGEVVGPDAFTIMTLVAANTTRLRLATGVIPFQTRTPTVLAQSAATLGHIAPGRFALGLGVSSPIIVEQWNGLSYRRPLEQLREAVHIIRAVMAGERVNFDGKHYRIKNLRMTSPPPPEPVRIYLGALGPAMLELAGEIADGVVLNWLGPEMVGACLKHVEIGAKRAGRSFADLETAAFIRTCVTDAPDAARALLARDITGYVTVDSYAKFFVASGFGDEVAAAGGAWKAGDRAGAMARISPRFLDALGVVGPADFCRDRVAQYARAGLTMPVVFPVSPDSDPKPSLLGTLRTFP